MHLIVLAAGRSRRFGTSKQTTPVGPSGEWLSDYTAYDAFTVGYERVTFVVSPDLQETFDNHLAERFPGRVTRLAVQAEPLGTGEAVVSALNKDPCAVVNADDFYGRESLNAVRRHLLGYRTSCIVCQPLRNTLSRTGGVSRGLCHVEGSRLVSITEALDVEKTEDGITGLTTTGETLRLHGDDLVSLNCWGFQPHCAALLAAARNGWTPSEAASEFRLSDAVDGLLRNRRIDVAVIESDEQSFGLTRAQDLGAVRNRITEMIGAGKYPSVIGRMQSI